MAHQYMSKVFHDPRKNPLPKPPSPPPPPPPKDLMYGALSLYVPIMSMSLKNPKNFQNNTRAGSIKI